MPKHRRVKNGHKVRTGSSKESSRGSVCPYCGKRSYMSRKYAKEAARIQYPTEHLSAYRCIKAPEFVDTSKLWHLGHLAGRVIAGRDEKSNVHGSPELRPARPEKRGPIPEALRAMVESKLAAEVAPSDNDNDEPEGGQMPTIGETAQLNLTGFDRHKGRYKAVSATSPIKDRVALVHGALRAYALTHSFDSYRHEGRQGFTGRVSLSALIRELFEVDDPDKQDGIAQAITQAGNKAGLIRCIESAHRQQGQLPIWWVAADYEEVVGHPPLMDPAAPKPAPPVKKATPPAPKAPEPVTSTPSERAKKGAETKRKTLGYAGRKPGSRNRTRIELLSLAERTVKSLGRPVLALEIYESADFPVTIGSVRDALDELVKERRVLRRGFTEEDREALNAVGGPRFQTPKTQVYLHASLAGEDKEVPVVTWELDPIDPLPELDDEPTAPRAQDMVSAGPESAFESADADDEDDIDAAIAALEKKASAPKADDAELEALRVENEALKARLARVTKQRDRLLAVVETMKDE